MREAFIAAVVLFPLAFMLGVVLQKLHLRARTQYVSPCLAHELKGDR